MNERGLGLETRLFLSWRSREASVRSPGANLQTLDLPAVFSKRCLGVREPNPNPN